MRQKYSSRSFMSPVTNCGVPVVSSWLNSLISRLVASLRNRCMLPPMLAGLWKVEK